jgi:hypothetical protein
VPAIDCQRTGATASRRASAKRRQLMREQMLVFVGDVTSAEFHKSPRFIERHLCRSTKPDGCQTAAQAFPRLVEDVVLRRGSCDVDAQAIGITSAGTRQQGREHS